VNYATTHRIGRICANPPGSDRGQNRNSEFVEVLTGSGNLAAHRLQQIINPKSQNPNWEDLFTFPTTANFGRETHVVVHSGAGKDDYDSQGYFHYYIAGTDGKGRWKLNNDGDVVRLLDAQGNELSRRALSGNECESIISTPVIILPTPAPRAFGKVDD